MGSWKTITSPLRTSLASIGVRTATAPGWSVGRMLPDRIGVRRSLPVASPPPSATRARQAETSSSVATACPARCPALIAERSLIGVTRDLLAGPRPLGAVELVRHLRGEALEGVVRAGAAGQRQSDAQVVRVTR